jgi:flavin-dependent dehydrogenase
MIKNTDVLIIGAGPSGCMAAYCLADYFDATIIESKQLPRNKPCSGVLINKTIDTITNHFGEIPEHVKCTPTQTTGLNVINENNELFEFPDNGMNVLRNKFDYWLTEKIVGKDVRLITSAKLIKYEIIPKGFLSTIKIKNTEIEINSKIVIACDGINGTSRKIVGAERQKKVLTFQRFYRGTADMEFSKFYAFTSPLFSRYDAWINSKDGNIIIGTIAKSLKEADNYFKCFIAYLEGHYRLKLEQETCHESWPLPLVFPGFNILYQFGGVFFAGEVAGFLNPFGEGISIALKSGKAVAEACIKNKINEDIDYLKVEKDYMQNMQDELSYMKRQWGYLKDISPLFFHNVLKLH